jgi:hypothetical protein
MTRQRRREMIGSVKGRPKGNAMMSPHTHVALTLARDREEARKAAHRPDAVPDPVVQRVESKAPSAARRGLAWLHLSHPHHV